jgi:hypothetical protein
MSKMKIAVRSWGAYRDNLDGFGGLELRYTVNYAHFLKSEGHSVHFYDGEKGCDDSFDLALDAPNGKCHLLKAKHHTHNWFSPNITRAAQNPGINGNACYQSGQMLVSDPYRYGYDKATSVEEGLEHNFKHILFLPIAYPDDLMPQNLVPGFDRNTIFWGNKGNFNRNFGAERNMHYVTNGIETLKALVKLNKKADFKMVFALNGFITTTREEWRGEIEDLIGQLKDVRRLDQVTWTQYLSIMAKTKINTHVGGLTSGINECLFTKSVPATPEKFIFFQDVAKEINMMPSAQTATADEIYDAYERLWFDEDYYLHVYEAFQDAFVDHRTAGLRRHWKTAMEKVQEGGV